MRPVLYELTDISRAQMLRRSLLTNRKTWPCKLNYIGTVYRNLGQYPKALELFLQSLAIARFVSDKAGEGRALNNIGLVYGSQSQYATALQFYQQANAIATAVRNEKLLLSPPSSTQNRSPAIKPPKHLL